MIKLLSVFVEGKAWWTGFEVESAHRAFNYYINKNHSKDVLMLGESCHSKVIKSHNMPEQIIFHPQHTEYEHLLICGKSLGGINVYETFEHLFENHLDYLRTRKSITLVFGDAYGTFFNFKKGFKTYSHKRALVIPEDWKKELPKLKIYNAYQRVKLDPFMGAYVVGADKQYSFGRCDIQKFNERPHMNFMAHTDWGSVINDIIYNIEVANI